MKEQEQEGLETPREQILYANLLLLGVWFGLFVLTVTFGLYVSGILTPHVPLWETPLQWGRGAGEYVKATGWPTGWSWVSKLHEADVLNYLGFVFLALLTVPGYLILLRAYLRRGDRLYSTICVLEILVLALAASGILVGGGH